MNRNAPNTIAINELTMYPGSEGRERSGDEYLQKDSAIWVAQKTPI